MLLCRHWYLATVVASPPSHFENKPSPITIPLRNLHPFTSFLSRKLVSQAKPLQFNYLARLRQGNCFRSFSTSPVPPRAPPDRNALSRPSRFSFPLNITLPSCPTLSYTICFHFFHGQTRKVRSTLFCQKFSLSCTWTGISTIRCLCNVFFGGFHCSQPWWLLLTKKRYGLFRKKDDTTVIACPFILIFGSFGF